MVPRERIRADRERREKTGLNAPEVGCVLARARQARQWLKRRPEREIAVVTHKGFLHYFVARRQSRSLSQHSMFFFC